MISELQQQKNEKKNKSLLSSSFLIMIVNIVYKMISPTMINPNQLPYEDAKNVRNLKYKYIKNSSQQQNSKYYLLNLQYLCTYLDQPLFFKSIKEICSYIAILLEYVMYTIRKLLYDINSGRKKVRDLSWIFYVLIGSTAGYQFGKHMSKKIDLSDLIEFKGQDEQIYKLLEDKPVLQLFYSPGDVFYEQFRKPFADASNKHKNVHFMLINCHKHYQYCRNIDFDRLPAGVLNLPKDYPNQKLKVYKMAGQFPQVDYLKEFDEDGFNFFFQDVGLIEKEDFTRKLKQL
ncbi:hypothetical protein pb186bvf_010944 [Paramecium bursaria]